MASAWSVRITDKARFPLPHSNFFDIAAKFLFPRAYQYLLDLGSWGLGFWCSPSILVYEAGAAISADYSARNTSPNMISKMDTNGDTASLKRKREPRDDSPLLQKKHRRRSKSNMEGNIISDASANGKHRQDNVAPQQVNGDPDSLGLPSQPPEDSSFPQSATIWKLSKPMGGRMLDIDPIFSLDERCAKQNTRTRRWQ
jgi:hypothetical protein